MEQSPGEEGMCRERAQEVMWKLPGIFGQVSAKILQSRVKSYKASRTHIMKFGSDLIYQMIHILTF